MELQESANLVSCHLLEVEKDGSLLWTWSYPHLNNQLRGIYLKKCAILVNLNKSEFSDVLSIFKYFRVDKQWVYLHVSKVLPPPSESTVKFAKVKHVGLIVGTDDFNPDKYERVGENLLRTYCKTENPSMVLQQFLSLVVNGKIDLSKRKVFALSDYNTTNPFSQHQIKAIIARFGLETILIYTGLMRKRKIVVYHYDIDVLTDVIMNLPALAWNTDNLWNEIYPWIDLSDEEIIYLKDVPFYIMGCTHAGVENRTDLYDIFVNIPAAEISVAPHAKEAVAMNKTHKEMALFMVQLANDSNVTEEEVIAEICRKSRELIDKL